MRSFLQYLFLPHHTNNHRAKILHHKSILFVVAFFIYQSYLFPVISHQYPRVLGASIDISAQQLLLLTNQKRQDAGIGPLALNDALMKAAQMKADYMFSRNFWAHNAPDGTMPWDFIKRSGYTYVYAGENLARGFTDTPDVINAWMASPDHRENMLSANYKDVGFAIEKGNLTGEKNTVLVVEMFGNTGMAPVAQKMPNTPVVQDILNHANTAGAQLFSAAIKEQPAIDTVGLTKRVGIFFLLFFLTVFFLDILIIKRRKIVRVFEHNLDHIMFLGFILVIIGILGRGTIF